MIILEIITGICIGIGVLLLVGLVVIAVIEKR